MHESEIFVYYEGENSVANDIDLFLFAMLNPSVGSVFSQSLEV